MSELVGSVKEVAQRLEVSEDRVRRLIREGKLPAWRMGPRTIRIPWKALDEWANAQATLAVNERAVVLDAKRREAETA